MKRPSSFALAAPFVALLILLLPMLSMAGGPPLPGSKAWGKQKAKTANENELPGGMRSAEQAVEQPELGISARIYRNSITLDMLRLLIDWRNDLNNLEQLQETALDNLGDALLGGNPSLDPDDLVDQYHYHDVTIEFSNLGHRNAFQYLTPEQNPRRLEFSTCPSNQEIASLKEFMTAGGREFVLGNIDLVNSCFEKVKPIGYTLYTRRKERPEVEADE